MLLISYINNKMNNHIAVITTWWTIFSGTSEKGILSGSKQTRNSLRKLEKTIKEKNIDIYETLNIDSSDINIENIQTINNQIKNIINQKKYQAILILHWTDSMTYSASAISYLNAYSEIPIIFTWSMSSITNNETDAFNNIYCGLQATEKVKYWTLICFWNKLLQANKSKKIANNRYSAFQSPNYCDIGNFIVDNEINRSEYTNKEVNKKLIINKNLQKRLDDIIKNNISDKDFWVKNEEGLSNNFAIVKLNPFCSVEDAIKKYVKQNRECIILEGYWDGNVPTNTDFIKAIERGTKEWILFVLWTQCISGDSEPKYAWWKALLDSWLCVVTKNMTIEATIAKVSFILWNRTTYEWRKKLLTKNLAWEYNKL